MNVTVKGNDARALGPELFDILYDIPYIEKCFVCTDEGVHEFPPGMYSVS